MAISKFHSGPRTKPDRGFTLLELIIAATILSVLTLMALPLARVTIQREKEKELRQGCGRCATPSTVTKMRPTATFPD